MKKADALLMSMTSDHDNSLLYVRIIIQREVTFSNNSHKVNNSLFKSDFISNMSIIIVM